MSPSKDTALCPYCPSDKSITIATGSENNDV